MKSEHKTRFDAKVVKNTTTDCWEWIAGKFSDGYGAFWLDQKLRKAHRVNYERFIGEIPNDTLVCHTCDVRHCVNPKHLFLGSPGSNFEDMRSKGRGKFRGSENGNSKITATVAKNIRQAKGRQIDIAKKYGVSQATVSEIKRRVTWWYVSD